MKTDRLSSAAILAGFLCAFICLICPGCSQYHPGLETPADSSDVESARSGKDSSVPAGFEAAQRFTGRPDTATEVDRTESLNEKEHTSFTQGLLEPETAEEA